MANVQRKFYHIKQLKQSIRTRSSQNTRCIFNQIIHTLHIHNVLDLLLALSHECRFQAADEHYKLRAHPLIIIPRVRITDAHGVHSNENSHCYHPGNNSSDVQTKRDPSFMPSRLSISTSIIITCLRGCPCNNNSLII